MLLRDIQTEMVSERKPAPEWWRETRVPWFSDQRPWLAEQRPPWRNDYKELQEQLREIWRRWPCDMPPMDWIKILLSRPEENGGLIFNQQTGAVLRVNETGYELFQALQAGQPVSKLEAKFNMTEQEINAFAESITGGVSAPR